MQETRTAGRVIYVFNAVCFLLVSFLKMLEDIDVISCAIRFNQGLPKTTAVVSEMLDAGALRQLRILGSENQKMWDTFVVFRFIERS